MLIHKSKWMCGGVLRRAARRVLAAAICAAGWYGIAAGASDADLPGEVIALSRITRNVNERLIRLSDFVCLETTQRWSRESARRDYKHVDTLQLEVAHIGKRELYSFPGTRAFDTDRPGDLASFGTTASGGFAGHLHTVFASGSTVIRFSGRETLNGREALRYEYAGSPLFDRMTITVAGQQGVTSTLGTFWADAQTLQLVRLEARVASVPPNLPVSDLVTTIDYAKVLLGGSEAWMPQSADMVMSYASGKQDNNRTVYTQCRQFVGESSLSFNADSSAAPSAGSPKVASEAPRVSEVQLPPGLNVPLQLETEVDSSRALVGASITATVCERVVARSGLVIPKGAVVRGRIRVLQREELPAPHFLVGLEFVELEFQNTRAPFYARMTESPQVQGLQVILSGRTTNRTKDYGAFRTETALWETARVPVLPGVSLFFMEGTSFRIPAGVRMTWQTSKSIEAP